MIMDKRFVMLVCGTFKICLVLVLVTAAVCEIYSSRVEIEQKLPNLQRAFIFSCGYQYAQIIELNKYGIKENIWADCAKELANAKANYFDSSKP